MIFRDPAGGAPGTAASLVGAIASLDRDTSMAGTLAELGRLKRVASESGEDRLDRGAPRQVDLRCAVSLIYYALFH